MLVLNRYFPRLKKESVSGKVFAYPGSPMQLMTIVVVYPSAMLLPHKIEVNSSHGVSFTEAAVF